VIRFHLDELVHGAVASALRHRGIDVTMPADVCLLSASDEQHLQFAFSENRVIVTQGSDFLALH
jgi:predicted nuclease of predicted toxin-antitoxin system